jgi:hypothetical protein
MKCLDFILAGSYGFVRVHSVLKTEAQDEMLGQGQSPWLHGMRFAKVHIFDVTVVMKGDLVASRTRDTEFFDIVENPSLEFGISPMSFIIFGHGWSGRHGRLHPTAIDTICAGGIIVLMVMMSTIQPIAIGRC